MFLKSLQDYQRKVLGLRFKGKSPNSSKSLETSDTFKQRTSNKTSSIKIAFLLTNPDYEAESEMIEKIQGLFNTTPKLLFIKKSSSDALTESPLSSSFYAQNLFIFGKDLKVPDQITYEDVHIFDSFSDISKEQNLKKALWLTLKNYA